MNFSGAFNSISIPSFAFTNTMHFTVPDSPPASFNATTINSTAIQLVWSEPPTPNGIIISYNITYNLSEMLASVLVDAEHGKKYVVTELDEYTVYRFEIFASTRVGPGPSTGAGAQTNETNKSSSISCQNIRYHNACMVNFMNCIQSLWSSTIVVHFMPSIND